MCTAESIMKTSQTFNNKLRYNKLCKKVKLKPYWDSNCFSQGRKVFLTFTGTSQ